MRDMPAHQRCERPAGWPPVTLARARPKIPVVDNRLCVWHAVGSWLQRVYLLCVCKYSKLTRLIPVFAGAGELAAPEVAKLFFENVVCLFGVPAMVLHDRDPRFTASFW